MEEFILLDDFTKDIFGIKEFGVIIDISDDTDSINKEMYNAFLGFLDKHDIGYNLIRQSNDGLYQFKITNYNAEELRKLLPKIVNDEDEKGVDDITIHGECAIVPSGTGALGKNQIDASIKYNIYWNRETGFYKMWDWRWDLESSIYSGNGSSGSSGSAGTSGSSGTSGMYRVNTSTSGTGTVSGSSGTSGTSGFLLKDLALLERLVKFIEKPITFLNG